MPAIEGYIFCQCLPISEESFLLSKNDPERDFIKHYKRHREGYNQPASWLNYKLELTDPYFKLKKGFGKYGIDFIDRCTFEEYKAIIKDPRNNVVILFSHCINNGEADEAIEFADTMVLSNKIIDTIPDEIARTYDYSVCRCKHLKELFQIRKGKNICGTSENFIPLSIWIYIYSRIFELVILKKCKFNIALNEVFGLIAKDVNSKK